MGTNTGSPLGAGAPKSPIGVVAHDMLNLITIAYGLQEEIEALDATTSGKTGLVSTIGGLVEKLENVARRLTALQDGAPSQKSASR